MIAIINRGAAAGNKSDLRRYEVKINTQTITFFTHARGDGLAECLRKAANAVEKSRSVEEMLINNYCKFFEETAR